MSARLFIVGLAPDPDDALDVVAAAAPALTKSYQEVRRVTPDGGDGLSLRGLRRGLRPGRDRVLYDFTQGGAAIWASETARTTPGAVLCGAARLPIDMAAAPALRRSRRRYGGGGRTYFTSKRVAALEADLPDGVTRLDRPAITIPRPPFMPPPEYACAAICAADGAAEAYGVIRAWRSVAGTIARQSDGGARLLISVATPEDAAEVHRYRTYLGATQERSPIDIEIRNRRADLGGVALRAATLIDLDRFSWDGRTDVFAVADAMGRPRLRVSGSLSDVAAETLVFLRSPPPPAPQPKFNVQAFAANLVRFIEAAQSVVVQNEVYSGAFE